MFLHLEEWLAKDTIEEGRLDPELLRNLSKAAENAAQLLADKANKVDTDDKHDKHQHTSTSTSPKPSSSSSSKSSIMDGLNNKREYGYGVLRHRYKQAQERASARAAARKKVRDSKYQQTNLHNSDTSHRKQDIRKQDRRYDMRLCRRWNRPWTWLRKPGRCNVSSVKSSQDIVSLRDGQGVNEKEDGSSVSEESVSEETCSEGDGVDNRNKRLISESDLITLVKLRQELHEINPNYIIDALEGGMSVDNVGLLRYLDVAYGEMEFKGVRVAHVSSTL